MSLSQRETQLIVDELNELVVPSRIQKVFEASSDTLVFQLRSPGITHHLLVSVDPDAARLYLVESKPRQSVHPSGFTMQLRKWIHGAWIEEISVSEEDRIVHLRLQAIDPDWEPESDDERAPRIAMTFIAELLGRHPNFFLVDDKQQIIGTGSGPILGERPGEPEAFYEAPPPPPEWADDRKVRPLLQQTEPDGQRSQRLARYFAQSLQEQERDDLRRSIRSRLKSRAKRLRRRVEAIESDLERIDDADQYRKHGELLQSAYGDVEPGASSVTVPDFYREDLPDVEIPLDPSRSLQENIEYNFHQYRRLTDARQKVEDRLLESIELRDAIERQRQRIDDFDDLEELEAFQEELELEGILRRRPKGNQRRSGQQKPLPPYREFKAQSGAAILVGRSASHNDTLTTSIARGRDMWLHARNWRGAHVVLRKKKNEELNSEDLIDAATLAAHFSRGSSDTVVDITYTEAKYVRKPSGAATGLVTIAGGSTLAVRIEKTRLQRLLKGEIEHR